MTVSKVGSVLVAALAALWLVACSTVDDRASGAPPTDPTGQVEQDSTVCQLDCPFVGVTLTCTTSPCSVGTNSITCGPVGTPPTPCPQCVPKTCASAGAECGTLHDGCGGTLDCGGCGTGQTCNANTCVRACTGGTHLCCDFTCRTTCPGPAFCNNL